MSRFLFPYEPQGWREAGLKDRGKSVSTEPGTSLTNKVIKSPLVFLPVIACVSFLELHPFDE